jgi:hypothetical protein
MRARLGKIARLPHALRDEVNRRMLDGQTSAQILAWLNTQAEAVAVWESFFEGAPATAQNLSEWRGGGYKEWITRREKVDSLKTLSAFAHDLAVAGGGNLADGAASIIAGHIVEALEESANLVVTGGSDDAEKDPHAGLVKMAQAVASLQKGSTAAKKLELDKQKVAQKDQQLALDREKFESQTVAKFLEWAKRPEAVAILDSGKPQHVQMDALRALMFGAVEGGAK